MIVVNAPPTRGQLEAGQEVAYQFDVQPAGKHLIVAMSGLGQPQVIVGLHQGTYPAAHHTDRVDRILARLPAGRYYVALRSSSRNVPSTYSVMVRRVNP